MTEAELWCVYDAPEEEYVATETRIEAEQVVALANAGRRIHQSSTERPPCQVMPWPFSAQEHQQCLKALRFSRARSQQ